MPTTVRFTLFWGPDPARALSKLNGYTYRTVDRRWPEEGELITIIKNGEDA
jgi:hypothetical protein